MQDIKIFFQALHEVSMIMFTICRKLILHEPLTPFESSLVVDEELVDEFSDEETDASFSGDSPKRVDIIDFRVYEYADYSKQPFE